MERDKAELLERLTQDCQRIGSDIDTLIKDLSTRLNEMSENTSAHLRVLHETVQEWTGALESVEREAMEFIEHSMALADKEMEPVHALAHQV